jgi:hypothetical protein
MEKEVGRKPAFTHDLAHGTKNHAHHKVMCIADLTPYVSVSGAFSKMKKCEFNW